ncbi:hypothetical protein PIB30_007163 [Stylosanthes scabra]|uniref:Uncharacterized protein n=1 Tax=Stylosanthes scabra TaxID=79078 RepID=A0ABU6T4B4_9FABA|nr:hypothetical protein [Stylosanthes scabra]
MKENSNPNLLHEAENNHSKQSKPIPVNLMKSLASLSMHSRNVNEGREEEEVMSKSNPIPPNPTLPEPVQKDHVCNNIQSISQRGFVFASLKDTTHATSPRLSIKQQARKKYKWISSVKRNSDDAKENQSCKKQCSEDTTATIEGEGATPQWAPNDL